MTANQKSLIVEVLGITYLLSSVAMPVLCGDELFTGWLMFYLPGFAIAVITVAAGLGGLSALAVLSLYDRVTSKFSK